MSPFHGNLLQIYAANPSSRKTYPPIERRSATLAAAAGRDAHAVGETLDRVAQAEVFFNHEAGQAYAMGLAG